MTPFSDAAALTTIEVNGRSFVSGLTWVALTKPHNFMDEARRIGKQRNMDMVAIREVPVTAGAAAQAGFAPKSPNKKMRGMYSLAAALSGNPTLGQNFLAVFELSADRYAFVAVHNGVVMAGRDIVADRATVEVDFNDVFQLLSTESTEEKWTKTGVIVAPEDWDYPAKHMSLEELLPPKMDLRKYRLHPLTFGLTIREIALICLACVLLIGAALGYVHWERRKEQQRTAEATALRLAMEQQKAAQEVAVIAKPWESEPGPIALLAACQEYWARIPLSLGGWVFAKGTCNAKGAAATFERPEHGTTVNAFTEAAVGAGFSPPAMYDMGTSAVFAQALSLEAKAADQLQSTTLALQNFTNTMQQASEASGTQFQMSEVPWTPPAEKPDAPAPDWKTTTFQVKTLLSPNQLLAPVTEDGMRIREIAVELNHDDAQLTWNITGEIYGR
ncbi:hypothetical protein CSC66_09375 [Pseudoxanthomonas kaohsiungensis]|nr:hypothetical protein CSC66_09375 [Pseudoxanthomonas kaohsiungensis]